MKRLILIFQMGIMMPYQFASAQPIDFEVTYDLQTYTTYAVNETERRHLLPQDTLKLLPELKTEHITEQFYADGSSNSEALIAYPEGLLETWIELIDRVVHTGSQLKAFSKGTLKYEEDIEIDPSTLIAPHSFAPYYLATNNWQLPLTTGAITELETQGFSVKLNTVHALTFEDKEFTVIYDKSDWSETRITWDDVGNELERKTTFYKANEDGYLLFDLIITATIEHRTQPCIEKVTYLQYTNISRTFHNSLCAPSLENGYVDARLELPQLLQMSANQLQGTDHLSITFPNAMPPIVHATIKDLYGGIIMENIVIPTDDPFIKLGELPTGVYHLTLVDFNNLNCKFLFQP
jgi:hypothetical protein